MEKNTRTVMILLGICVIMLAFILGFVMVRMSGSSKTPEPIAQGATGADAGAAPAIAPAAPDAPLAEVPAGAKLQDPASWVPQISGCKIEQTGSKLHIFGETDADGWGHDNGLASSKISLEGSFVASVDFMVPQFSGPGNTLVYLRAKNSNGRQVAILYQPRSGSYQVQGWNDTNQFSQPPLRKFGDEDATFHRMKLQYDDATKVASGWVDDRFIGTLNYSLDGTLTFEVVANTDKKGMQIDLVFDHLTVTKGTGNGAAVPPTGARAGTGNLP